MSDEAKHIRFSYAEYEAAIRAPYYRTLQKLSADNAVLFRGCRRVLDIGSGQGLMLDELQRIGVPACGVDGDPRLIQECRERGLEAVEDDIFHYLNTTQERFDGVYCGHVIEHLQYESLLDLVEGVCRVMPAGIIVLRWPNPRSLLAQHDLFWKDPTHVRFYDGSFVEAVLRFYGFQVTEVHYDTVAPRPAPADAPAQGVGPAAVGQSPSAGRSPLRSFSKQALNGLMRGPLRATGPVKRLADLADGLSIRRNQMALLRLLLTLPVEAQIAARRG